MSLNQRGLDLIAEFEGFRATPYNDPVGHCTVGYGELLHLGNCTPEELTRAPITEEQGYAYLREKVQPYYDTVVQFTRPLNENEAAALTSLCYNIGPGGYLNSSVRSAVNSGGDVCAELRKIVHGTDGVTYPGLVRRREAECELYHASVEGEPMTEAERKELNDLKAIVWNNAVQNNTKNQAQDLLLVNHALRLNKLEEPK